MTFDLIPVQDNSRRAVGIVALLCSCSTDDIADVSYKMKTT